MRKQLFTLVLLLIAGIGFARGQGNYDFFSVSSGDTLYFKSTGLTTCKVVPPSYYGDWFGFTQPSGNVTIPDHVSGHEVTEIGENAFYGCTGIGSVYVPPTVATVGASAFQNCSYMTEIHFDTAYNWSVALDTIGPNAFLGCSRLVWPVFGGTLEAWMNVGFGNAASNPAYPVNINGVILYGWFGNVPRSVDVPSSITKIKKYTFYKWHGIHIVTMNNTLLTPVTSIGDSAFYGCAFIDTVQMNSHVTSIGAGAFQGCSNLVSIQLGSDVNSIGASAFRGCSSLGQLTIPSGVPSIGDNTFAGCTNLRTMTIPNSVTTIGNYAFNGCSNMTSVTIGNHVSTIGNNAFSGCGRLITITIPRSVTSIGNSAFSNCSFLSTVNFNADSCLTMASSNSFFAGCTRFSTLNFGSHVKVIPANAFKGCTLLSMVLIPDSVVSIGSNAFQNCTGMTSITIGRAVSTIGNNTFQNCTALTTVNYNADSCVSMGNNSNNRAFNGCTNISVLNIGSNVKRIPDYAFQNCSGITTLTLPNSVVAIGQNAFDGCSGLTSITIERAVSTIGNNAFQNCTGLTTVNFNADSCVSMGNTLNNRAFNGCTNISTLNIGNSVKRIPNYAFPNCTGLMSLTIPDSVVDLGAYAFSGCSGLTSLTIGNTVQSIGSSAFSNCTGLPTVVIPNSVTNIGSSAFSGCNGLSSLAIGNAVSTIGNSAFLNCTGLDTVNFYADSCVTMGSADHPVFSGCTNIATLNIGNNVKRIPEYAFRYCTGLTSLTIPDSVVYLGDYAFIGCSGLTTLTIGKAVSTIGQYAFVTCAGLTTVNFNADSCIDVSLWLGGSNTNRNTTITNVNIGSNVKVIPNAAFHGCPGITTLTIPDSVVTIGSRAFQYCSGLTSLTIGNSVSSIEFSAFGHCTALTTVNFNADSCVSMVSGFSDCDNISTVNIGSNVKRIPDYAFYGFSNLSSITAHCMTPPVIGSSAFYNVSRSIPVYVPCNRESVYRASAWNTFTNIIEPTVCPNYDFWAVAPSGDTLYYSIQNANSVKVVHPFASGWGTATRPIGTVIIPSTVVNNGVTYTVTSIGDSAFYSCTNMTEVTIPNPIDSIGVNAFIYCSGLTTVNFNADSCIYAGSWNLTAFYGCTNFTHLNFGSNVKRIPSYAFKGCTHLDTVTFPASIATMGYNAFYGCSGLTTVYFNADSCYDMGLDNVNNTHYFGFGGCNRFTLVIGDSVKLIPPYGFAGINTFDIVLLSSIPPTIGYGAFYNTSVGTVKVPCSSWWLYVESEWWQQFWLRTDNCPNYDFWAVAPSGDTLYYSITDSNRVKVVHPYLSDFDDELWASLTQPSGALIIPSTVMHDNIEYIVAEIGKNAFVACEGITSVTITDSIATIGNYAFDGCYLDTVIVTRDMPPTLGYEVFNDLTIPVIVPCESKNLYRSSEWNHFEHIIGAGNCTYYDFWAIAPSGDTLYYIVTDTNSVKVVYPDDIDFWNGHAQPTGALVIPTTVANEGVTYNVTRIDGGTFANCAEISSMTIPEKIVQIGDSAFSGCTGLLTVNYNAENCTTGGFAGNSHITTLNIGSSVAQMPANAFQNCTALDTVNFNADSCLQMNSVFGGTTNITILNIGSNVKRIPEYAFSGCTGLTSLTIGNAVWYIGNSAFYGCTGIATLTIGNSVSSIDNSAFGYCTALDTVFWNADSCIQAGYSLDYRAFVGCTNLSAIIFGNNVKRIPSFAFAYCDGLDTLTIPDSVASIGLNAFYGCSSLTTVNFNADSCTVAGYNEQTGYIYFAFGGCPNFSTLNIAEDVKVLPDFGFWNCYGLQHVTVPNSVTSIGESAFRNCTGLMSIEIGNGVNRIDNSAFRSCTTLTTIISHNTVAPTVYLYTFVDVPTTANVYIPCGSRTSYESEWSYFTDFIDMYHATLVSTTADTVMGTAVVLTQPTCGVAAVMEAVPNYGYHFDHWSDGDTTNPRQIVVDNGDSVVMTAYFAPNMYTLNVVSSNSSWGAATGSGVYAYTTVATITAVPEYGYHFVAWSDNDTNATRTISVTHNETLVALFARNPYDVVLASANNIAGGTAGDSTYLYLDTAILTAIPNYGYHFTMWNDSVTDNPRTIVVTRDTLLTASFARNPYEVTTQCNTVRGAVTGAGVYLYEDTATVVATANYGYHFTMWNDGVTANPRTIVVTRDTSLTALFDRNPYDVLATCNVAQGIVTGSNTYLYEDTATLTAIAGYGYHFTMWSDGVTANPRTIVVTRDTSLTALFDRNQYVVTTGCNAVHGTSTGAGTYLYEDTATLLATANYGYHFTMWSDGVTVNPRTIVVTRDTSLTALFDRNPYDVLATCNTTQGIVTGSNTYLYEDTATLTAIAGYGYHFTMWSDGVTANPRTIVVTRDTALTALFGRNSYVVVASCNTTQGNVAGSSTYLYEDTATLTATANYGYHFTMWNDGVTANPRAIVVTRDTALTALFDRNSYVVAGSCNTTQGSVVGSSTYLYEDTATLTAAANYGYHFAMWSDGVTANPRTIVVTRDTLLTALFDRNSYSVTAQCDTVQGGVAGAGTYQYEDSATLTATANYGYHFTMWSDGVVSNPRILVVTGDTVLTALFDRNQYTLTLVCDQTLGTVTGAGTYLYGDTATVTVSANEGYVFNRWAETGSSEQTFDTVINGDVVLTALFDTLHYTLTVESNNPDWGSVTGGGEYAYGTEVVIAAIANEGYRFVNWSDGSEETPRTIIVTEDVVLTAVFAEGVGIETVENTMVSLYPNPTTDVLNIKAENVEHVEVYDLGGRKVLSLENQCIIDFSSMPSGVYYVKIMCPIGTSVHKVVKK